MPGLDYDRLKAHSRFRARASPLSSHPSNHVRKASLNQIKKILPVRSRTGPSWAARTCRSASFSSAVAAASTTVVEAELLDGKCRTGPHIIYVKTALQLVQVIEQEPGAIGFAQLALAKQRGLPEIVTETPVEQTLSLVTFGDPTPAMKAVIDAAREPRSKRSM